MLRASSRVTYNEAKSTINEPFYDFVRPACHVLVVNCSFAEALPQDRSEKIPPGTIVPLLIGIWPTGVLYEPGETLVLRIAGRSLILPEFKIMTPDRPIDFNVGLHNVSSFPALLPP